jgi:putative ABC transport system substrate-binding protein
VQTQRTKIINLAIALFVLLLPWHHLADAQQPGKVPRIGFLQRRTAPTPANPDPLADAFQKGLRELGYIDGKNIKIEHRYAEGRSDRLDALIAEFLQLKVDVIVVPGSPAIRAAKQATKTIPLSS